jgi:hypothetical protein
LRAKGNEIFDALLEVNHGADWRMRLRVKDFLRDCSAIQYTEE